MRLVQADWHRTDGVRRRWSAVLLVVIAMTTMLVACGGGNTAPTAQPIVPVVTATQGSVPVSPSAAPTRASGAPTVAATRTGTATTNRPPTQAITTAFPGKVAGLDYGMNVWLPTADQDKTLDLLTGAGFGWARQWISWESVEPTPGSVIVKGIVYHGDRRIVDRATSRK